MHKLCKRKADGGFESSDPGRCTVVFEGFAAILNRAGYASPIRTPRGRDILAACGQLKSESEKLRASARRKIAREAQDAAEAG